MTEILTNAVEHLNWHCRHLKVCGRNTVRLMRGLLLLMAPIPRKISVVSVVCSWYSGATGIVTDYLSLIPKASAIVLVICVLSIPLSRRA